MAENLVFSSSQFSSNINENQFKLTSTAETKDYLSDEKLIDFYDLEKCVSCLKKCEIVSPKVALQFPDVHLCNSARVAQLVEEKVNCKTYILADTSYGSCCVDEIAAEHVKSDLIIHFGQACLSQTERIPVLFMFGKEKIEIDHCCQSFHNCFAEKDCKILMIYDVVYHHAIDTLYSRLAKEYNSLVLSSVNCFDDFICKKKHVKTDDTKKSTVKNVAVCNKNESDQKVCCEVTDNKLNDLSLNEERRTDNSHCRFGRTLVLENGCSIEDYVVFYIGNESLTLTNHMMAYNKCQFYSYNPETLVCRKETLNVNRLLMKRYYLIERAKDAQVVGILIGTLGIANYLSILNRIKKILRQCGKKYYTFVVGKINPEKLANFMEIDLFVLIACSENSLISSQDFYKPIITPFEIEIACSSAREWSGEYITDFQELLPGAVHHVDIENKKDTEEEEIPDISLISGQLRPVYGKDENRNMKSESLVLRNQDTTLSTQHHMSAAEFLAQRSWKGLEIQRGETQVTEAVEGRSGIASGYTHELEQGDNT